MIEWYLKAVRDNYANFEGRASRPEYWYFFLANFLVGFILGFIGAIVPIVMYVSYLYSLAVLVPSIAAAVRRIHDVGKSGWYVLIPIYNIVLLATEGQNGPNEFGPDPVNPYNELNDIGRPDVY
ncbi:cytochrome [Flavobacterium akiainvivens]|uniref:Cytochrome n=1 Tax=Flavobacterium akiainvivens TaxID=1202724 RepID=A0A0M8MJT2_9FLAO|nr:DUF805 domain-containing protein [Flavobacterium akiainvivens]KOS07267.1 cytochrome [Flavobacterium akiainvivens]